MVDQNPVLSEESRVIFNEAISMVLSRWSALQLAVENEWGGRNSREKAEQLHADIFSWFTLSKEPLYIDDLEDKIYEGLLSLNTEVEDGSVEEIAEKLMIIHEDCLKKDFTSIETLRELHQRRVPVSHVRQGNDTDDDDEMEGEESHSITNNGSSKPESNSSAGMMSNSEDMIVDEPMPKPSVEAADGWEVVGPKRGRGKRN